MCRSPVIVLAAIAAMLGAPACAPGTGAADPQPGSAAPAQKPAEVVVLGTLHQYHDDVPGYSFAELASIIRALEPDIVAVELTPADLATRSDQKTKREYPLAVYPLLDEFAWDAIALEPPPPLYDELVDRFRAVHGALRENAPAQAEAFGIYTEALYEMLFDRWNSAADVNSPATDLLFDLKHRYQGRLFGPGEVRVWQEWNGHFLERIEAAGERAPGARIVVLVGVEHAYWLRAALGESALRLLDTRELLSGPGD